MTIYFGLDHPDVKLGASGNDSWKDRKGLIVVICFYIAEFFIFVFELYLILSKRNREKKSAPIGGGGTKLHFVHGSGVKLREKLRFWIWSNL